MAYLSTAWNTGNVQELDYVTDPAGRQEMDSMAAQMVNLQFKNCTENPAGDYTCYFNHDITPSDSQTEAVKVFETSFCQMFCSNASSGSLIQATVGIFGGVGRPAKRDGLAS
jgi:hypothetical protein